LFKNLIGKVVMNLSFLGIKKKKEIRRRNVRNI